MEFTTTVTLDETTLSAPPAEVGEWMADAAVRVWFQYNDNGDFEFSEKAGTYTLTDPSEEKTVSFTTEEFFKKHVELIWLAGTKDYRHDWIDFAFRSNDADADEYDDNTVDCVLQTMLYGTIVYG